MQIAVDVDGVLADAIVTWIEIYNADHRGSLRKVDITYWDFFGTLNINRAEFNRIFELAWDRWREIPPCEVKVGEKVRELTKLGKVSIVTARTATSISNVKEWLKDQLILYDDMVVVEYGPLKGSLDFDVFIDDSPLNAKSISESGKQVLLYDQPWNRDVKGEGIVRVRGLVEAIDAIAHLVT
ncbi:MAG: hypothetical protein ACE5KG_04085 [Nitrososphaerales archaeon]